MSNPDDLQHKTEFTDSELFSELHSEPNSEQNLKPNPDYEGEGSDGGKPVKFGQFLVQTVNSERGDFNVLISPFTMIDIDVYHPTRGAGHRFSTLEKAHNHVLLAGALNRYATVVFETPMGLKVFVDAKHDINFPVVDLLYHLYKGDLYFLRASRKRGVFRTRVTPKTWRGDKRAAKLMWTSMHISSEMQEFVNAYNSLLDLNTVETCLPATASATASSDYF